MESRSATSLRLACAALLVCLSVPRLAAQDLQPGRNFPTASQAFGADRSAEIDFGDVDLDGDLDVLVGNGMDGSPEQNRIYINLGGLQAGTEGTFADETLTRLPLLPLERTRDIDFLDLDGDGDLDIVVLFSQEWETVQAFINDGRGHFTPIVLHDVADADYSSSGISVGDIDSDGDPDIAWTNGDAFVSVGYRPLPSHGLQWLENRGNLDFAFHRIGDFHGAYAPNIVDLDGDGDQDIVAVSEFAYWQTPGTPSLRWWAQDENGHFTPQDLAQSPTHLVSCDVGDLDGDGTPDIVAGGMALYQPFDRVARVVRWSNQGLGQRVAAAAGATPDTRVADAAAGASSPGERAMIFHANGMVRQADRHYAEAAQRDQDNAHWPYFRGLLDLEVGDSAAAASHLERAASLEPDYPPLQSRLGELYAGQGNIAAAEQAFLAAGDLPLAHLGRARIAFADEDWSQVLEILGARRIPAGDAMRAAAQAHLRGDSPEDAAAVDMGLQYRDPWLDDMRDHALLASAIVVQAQIAFIEGDLLRTERLLRRAVVVEPNDADARLALANVLLDPSQATPASIDEALLHLDRGMRQAPADVALRSQRAWALFLLNREAEAASEWEAILAEEPEYAPSMLNLGQLHAKAGRHGAALDYFRAGMAVPRDSAFSGSFEGPYRAAWLLKHAASAKAMGQHREAIEALSGAVALTPDDPAARFQLGNTLLGMKQFGKAAAQLEAADALLPSKPSHLAALGYALSQLGRLEEADGKLSAAVAGAPRYALAWFHLGNVKASLGDRDAARACFTRALDIRPDFQAAREGLERVR